jgi:hypothetical protein
MLEDLPAIVHHDDDDDDDDDDDNDDDDSSECHHTLTDFPTIAPMVLIVAVS